MSHLGSPDVIASAVDVSNFLNEGTDMNGYVMGSFDDLKDFALLSSSHNI